ncbi:hypothetical protein N7508_006190 [Penicillium antarcticum]|uniref:uncharacterized protein n=1 Tax=Penicillium antarcticum TaxID=416450 RepID=UPI00239307D9|nr:uncharacterized protein N7508_006190 [Penicillium antarcticum]KAJ5301327.1 hypothetical protein N7508_006190 [Penicillium antarcticum]
MELMLMLLVSKGTRGGDVALEWSSAKNIRARVEIVRASHEAAGDKDTLMEQLNAQGTTWQRMMMDKRRAWQDTEERIRTPSSRRGRGQPQRGGQSFSTAPIEAEDPVILGCWLLQVE